jgi:hypothetical protein
VLHAPNCFAPSPSTSPRAPHPRPPPIEVTPSALCPLPSAPSAPPLLPEPCKCTMHPAPGPSASREENLRLACPVLDLSYCTSLYLTFPAQITPSRPPTSPPLPSSKTAGPVIALIDQGTSVPSSPGTGTAGPRPRPSPRVHSLNEQTADRPDEAASTFLPLDSSRSSITAQRVAPLHRHVSVASMSGLYLTSIRP